MIQDVNDGKFENSNMRQSVARRVMVWNAVFGVIGLLPLIVYLIAMPSMPNRVPMRYGDSGIESWGSNVQGLASPLLSLFVCVLWMLSEILVVRSIRKRTDEDPFSTLKVYIIGGCGALITINVLNIYYIWTVFNNGNIGNASFNGSSISNIVAGLVFIVLGNIVPNSRPNGWSGLRTPWAYKSRETWRRCQRVGGILLIAGGVVLVAVGLVFRSASSWIIAGVAVVLGIIGIVYSIYAAQKYGNIGGSLDKKR
ncbi:SdpI family protein [Bifidobacterium sp. ESL0775]|uniref:SdpI family protein n=1 Tax=Bifidobacterium sp. ESL0775 TaxID=2983230 RepID=UPI0023F95CEE|nr:SdpI family protein [Bifidobacterium sp. ESL0775]WEV68603.1 SdpI family protein [Bifidobacterium sp. ESL0775]